MNLLTGAAMNRRTPHGSEGLWGGGDKKAFAALLLACRRRAGPCAWRDEGRQRRRPLATVLSLLSIRCACTGDGRTSHRPLLVAPRRGHNPSRDYRLEARARARGILLYPWH